MIRKLLKRIDCSVDSRARAARVADLLWPSAGQCWRTQQGHSCRNSRRKRRRLTGLIGHTDAVQGADGSKLGSCPAARVPRGTASPEGEPYLLQTSSFPNPRASAGNLTCVCLHDAGWTRGVEPDAEQQHGLRAHKPGGLDTWAEQRRRDSSRAESHHSERANQRAHWSATTRDEHTTNTD